MVAAGARAHRWFKLGSDHEKCGAFRCGWLVVAVAGGWQSGGASLSLHPFLPTSFNLRVSATIGNSFNYLILIYYRYHIALVRSNKPCTLRLRRAAWALRSHTWYVGVFFFGIQAFVLPSPVFVAERSTTRGVDENFMTSRYSAFVSVVRVRTEGALGMGSVSDSSVSERPDSSNGGVGSRGLNVGTGSGGSSPSSRIESLPFRYEFSILRKRTAPLKLSSCCELRACTNKEDKNRPVPGDVSSPSCHRHVGRFVTVRWSIP